MASWHGEVTIDRAPDDVWDVIGEFGGLDTWMPGVESCEVDGDVRVVETMGMSISERLNERDEDAYVLSYSIVEGPLPVTSHTATITVVPEGDGSRVTWDLDVEPGELSEAMGPVYQSTLDALKAKLEA